MRINGGQVFDLRQGFVQRDVCTDGPLLAETSGDSVLLDASGCYVIPGLVDVHFHGCVGEDFSDATPDGLQKIADFELSQGVTYICPAGMTLPEDQLTAICKNTAADYDTAKAAFEAGANHVTHTYNGMPGLHHREPSVIGAAYEVPGVLPELICDGVHIHGSVVRLTFGLFGGERMILISDSLRATGMPDGEYPFGGQMIELHGNRATILGHPETLAGSVTSLMGCLRQAVSFGIPLADAVRACTFNPARSIGIDGRTGSLDTGKEASIVLLDEKDLSVKAIIFKGQKV